MLTHQEAVIREKIDQLTNALKAVEALKQEVLQMQSVDFKKYADIIVNLQMKNEYYWLIKHFDDDTLDHIRRRFDRESGIAFMERFEDLNEKILRMKEKGISPEDSRVQEAAEEFWKLVMEFTGGDMSLLPKLMEFGSLLANTPESDSSPDGNDIGNAADETEKKKAEWISRQTEIQEYLQPALELYFQRSGNPFGRKEYEVCNTDFGAAQKLWQYRGIKRIDFQVKKGEIFGILGVNGAGKTTTLECIEGFRGYDYGEITVDGKIGIQLQSASLPAYIKAGEAVRLFAEWNHAKPDPVRLSELGIQELEKKRYVELSTGQKRRLHLALALTGDPDILFLDEPTAGLDVEGRISLHKEIFRLKEQGRTIIMASHDMTEVENLCSALPS